MRVPYGSPQQQRYPTWETWVFAAQLRWGAPFTRRLLPLTLAVFQLFCYLARSSIFVLQLSSSALSLTVFSRCVPSCHSGAGAPFWPPALALSSILPLPFSSALSSFFALTFVCYLNTKLALGRRWRPHFGMLWRVSQAVPLLSAGLSNDSPRARGAGGEHFNGGRWWTQQWCGGWDGSAAGHLPCWQHGRSFCHPQTVITSRSTSTTC